MRQEKLLPTSYTGVWLGSRKLNSLTLNFNFRIKPNSKSKAPSLYAILYLKHFLMGLFKFLEKQRSTRNAHFPITQSQLLSTFA